MPRSRRFLCILILAVLASAALQAAPTEPKKVVNVNSADSAKLMMLPRVGSAVADRIVEYRTQNGLFKTPEDLMLVNGVGEKLFNEIKPYVVTSGATTLTDKVRGTGRKSGARGKKGASPKKAKAPKSSPKASSPKSISPKASSPKATSPKTSASPGKAVTKETTRKKTAKGATLTKKAASKPAAGKGPLLKKASSH